MKKVQIIPMVSITKDKVELLIIVQIWSLHNVVVEICRKSTTSNSQNMGVTEKKCKKNALFDGISQKLPGKNPKIVASSRDAEDENNRH